MNIYNMICVRSEFVGIDGLTKLWHDLINSDSLICGT